MEVEFLRSQGKQRRRMTNTYATTSRCHLRCLGGDINFDYGRAEMLSALYTIAEDPSLIRLFGRGSYTVVEDCGGDRLFEHALLHVHSSGCTRRRRRRRLYDECNMANINL